jgi:hypothetical protein
MAIAQLSPTRGSKGPVCTVCKLLARLEPAEANALRSHLTNPEWRLTELSDALFEEGHDVPGPTLARHARGQCAAREKLR